MTAAQQADVVLLFLGLPAAYESEGFDRTTLDIPAKQVEVLEAVAAANPNVAVVLSNGSVVSLPWRGRAKAILETWLLGQAGGAALADVIFGDEAPSGKLAQTIIDDVNDDPSAMNWPGEEGHVDYGEGVFVGYRYHDTFRKQVTYPFGYGLSYATFDVHDATVAKTGPLRASPRSRSNPASRRTSPSRWTTAPSPTGRSGSTTGMWRAAPTRSRSAYPRATSSRGSTSRSTTTARS